MASQHDPNTESESDPNTESGTGSNERTDERTYGADNYGRHSGIKTERERAYSGSNAITLAELLADDGKPRRMPTQDEARTLASLLSDRYRVGQPRAASIHEAMLGWLDSIEEHAGKRWPVVRSGPRDPIAWMLRLSVYRRDDFTCKRCVNPFGTGGEHLELDHCIPWSAGGPDDSDNLRTLCHWCNQERSNWIDNAHATNYRATTWWCFDCWTRDNHKPRPIWADGTCLDLAPFVDEADGDVELVYCAWCQHYSTSPLPLVGSRGRRLIETAAPPSSSVVHQQHNQEQPT